MTYGVVGAILLAVLVFMVWRGHAGITGVILAVLLGVVIAKGSGMLGSAAGTVISGIQSIGGAVSDAISGGGR
jgi:hypothetical protein